MFRSTILTVLIVFIILFVNNVLSRESRSWYDSGPEFRDVNSAEGILRGHVAREGRYEYLAFLGVPYAAPPLGRMRYKPAFPLGPWKGIKECNRAIKCSQNGTGEEDCLVLNIFTPLCIHEPLPVLVYIHGGYFLLGKAPTEGVKALIQQNIIVVTINYRLGALGFLCLGTKEIPGNMGLKDQNEALKWINRNIEYFGGNPDKVTIYGLSAGGASVEYHVLSPMSAGLFQQAIVESGSATAVWAIDRHPLDTAKLLIPNLNTSSVTGEASYLSTKNWNRLMEFLYKVSDSVISEASIQHFRSFTDGTLGFVPCLEKRIPGRKKFVVGSPHRILTKELYKKVPMMFIFSTMEGLFLRSAEYYQLNYKEKMNRNFVNFLPADLDFDSHEIREQVADNIKSFYFGNGTIGDDLVQYLNYFGDHYILEPLLNSVEIHSRKNNTVYLMEFAYKGNLGGKDKFYDDIELAGHGDAKKYVFLKSHPTTDEDKLTVRRMVKLLANFVKFGDPTPERTDILPIKWPTVTPEHVTYLYLDKDLEIHEDPYWGRKVFWDSLYTKLRKPVKVQ